jgi:hypothetical protein
MPEFHVFFHISQGWVESSNLLEQPLSDGTVKAEATHARSIARYLFRLPGGSRLFKRLETLHPPAFEELSSLRALRRNC